MPWCPGLGWGGCNRLARSVVLDASGAREKQLLLLGHMRTTRTTCAPLAHCLKCVCWRNRAVGQSARLGPAASKGDGWRLAVGINAVSRSATGGLERVAVKAPRSSECDAARKRMHRAMGYRRGRCVDIGRRCMASTGRQTDQDRRPRSPASVLRCLDRRAGQASCWLLG